MLRGKFLWLKWLALALAVLSAAVVFEFWSARSRYENQLSQQIWPVVAPEISIISNSPADFKSTVLLLGDSRMAQWDLPPLAGWRVVNAGAGGLTTGQLRLCAPKLLDEFHPDAVVLEAGINDLKFIGLRRELSPQMISLAASNLTAIVHECAARHCQVIVLETWPVGQQDLARRLVWSAEIPAAVDALNAQLKKLNAPEQGIRVVDLFKETGLKPEAGLYCDALHFKPEVYQRLTPALERELEVSGAGFQPAVSGKQFGNNLLQLPGSK
jgi:lysophospholipase L1-like esterase